MTDDEYPDIALEVVLKSGGINKLEVYRGLAVSEVWFWQNRRFAIHRLAGSTYERVDRSSFLPDLDFENLAQYVEAPDQHAALKAFRGTLRSRP